MMLMGLYARVSTDKQDVQQQVDYLRGVCLTNGWKYRSYVDNAVSGSISDRPSWIRLLNDLSNKRLDGILIMKYDRITRDLEYALNFLNYMRKCKIKLFSVWNGGWFDFEDVDQEFQFKLDCLLSERELKIIKQRSKIGIERAKKQGKYLGRKKGAKNRK